MTDFASTATHLEFAPAPPRELTRGLLMAIVVHALLVAALTWGVSWRNDPTVAVEAELWSALPVEAAPTPVEAPPPPPPAPVIEKKLVPDADIVLAKKRAHDKKIADDKKAAEEKKQKLLEDQQREKQEKLKEKKELEAIKKIRDDQMTRVQGLAGASGSPTATGSALKASGPSANWAGRISARIKSNISFDEVARQMIQGNPTAEVQVRLAPNGTITNIQLLKSSGVKNWDEAVLRAIEKTETLPRDVDGTFPSREFSVYLRPKD